MTENRLPPNRVLVSGCSTCPLRELFDAELGVSECRHPEGKGRDVTGEEGVPDFCPLDRAPLLLAVSHEART